MMKVFDAPFSGSRCVLTNRNTICEYNGTVDASGNLIDVSGAFVTAQGVNKAQHNLAPTGALTAVTSGILDNNKNRWVGRYIDGTNFYKKAHSSNFNLGTGDFTITVLLSYSSTVAGTSVFTHADYGAHGIDIFRSAGTSSWSAYVYGTGGNNVSKSMAADGLFHAFQIVRKSGLLKVIVDGDHSKSVTCTADVNVTAELIIGALYQGPAYTSKFTGGVLYLRWDAEALSDTQLEFERQSLMGWAANTSSKAPPTFARASAGYANIQGNLYSRMSNGPRVQTAGCMLIEEAKTNLQRYSQAFNNWASLNNLTVPTTNAASLDPNSNTACILHESGAGSTTHWLNDSAVTVTNGAVYTYSVFVKAINRNWMRLLTYDGTISYKADFDFSRGIKGTVVGGVTAAIDAFANGWYRCSITFTQTNGTNCFCYIYIAAADNVVSFDAGAGQDSLYIWGAQLELGSHATSYVATTNLTAERKADDHTTIPWELNANTLVRGGETWWSDFSTDVAAAATVTLNGKTFTQAGDVKHRRTPDLGHYYDFDGTGDYLSIADSSFNPAGSFSVVAVVTPTAITSNHAIAAKYISAGNQRGWDLEASGTAYSCYVSRDGDAATERVVTKASSIVVGKTSLITFTFQYSGNNTLNDSTGTIYVDDLPAGTNSSMYGPVYASSDLFRIGSAGGGSIFNGKIHYIGYYDGQVLTQSDHAALYDKFKKDGILPINLGVRTNLQRYSQGFNNWTSKSSVTVPVTNASSPDHTSDTACVLHEGVAGDGDVTHFVQDTAITVVPSAVYTYSVYAKAINTTWIKLRNFDTITSRTCYFDILNGVVGTAANATGYITGVGDGWFRCSMVSTQTAGQTQVNDFIYLAQANNDDTFVGSDRDSAYVWGAQLEVGSYPSAQIPTVAAAVSVNHRYSKILIAFDARALWAGTADFGALDRYFLSIGGSTGDASASRNSIEVYFDDALYVPYALLNDNSGTYHYIRHSSDPGLFNQWHHYEIYFDLSNFANSYFKRDTTSYASKVNMTGSAAINLRNTRIRLGQFVNGDVSAIRGNLEIKNLRIQTYE